MENRSDLAKGAAAQEASNLIDLEEGKQQQKWTYQPQPQKKHTPPKKQTKQPSKEPELRKKKSPRATASKKFTSDRREMIFVETSNDVYRWL